MPLEDDFAYNRAVYFSNRAACRNKQGCHEDVVKDCDAALELSPTYVKALVRRAIAHEALENLDAALADRRKVLEITPMDASAIREEARVAGALKVKQEQMKDEMMGKLKDLGNSILGKFGMSLDNFAMKQDPKTGSYSVSYNPS